MVAPTHEWGYLNSIIQGGSTSTFAFLRGPALQSNHIIDYNLISSPQQCHIASVIAMVQHQGIRQRLHNWLNQFHHATYLEFFDNMGNLKAKWLQDSSSLNIMGQSGATTAAAQGHHDEATAAAATSATAASASASPTATTSTSGTSITSTSFSQAHRSSSRASATTTTTTKVMCRWTTSTAEQQQRQQDDGPTCKPQHEEQAFTQHHLVHQQHRSCAAQRHNL